MNNSLLSKLAAVVATASLATAPFAGAAELIGLFDFEGNFNDSSAAGNNPTAVDPDVAFSPGNGGGQAATFVPGLTGTGINVPIDMNAPNLTIGGWVNAAAVNNSAPWGNDDGGWDRGISTATFGSTWGVSNSINVFDSGLPVSGSWQFIAATYRGNRTTLNVDGSEFSHLGFLGPNANPGMAVGSLNPGAVIHEFSGLIDNFFVYDDALSAVQLESIRTGGLGAISQTMAEGLRTTVNTWDFETDDLTGWNIVTTTHGDDAVFATPGNMPTTLPATGFDDASVQGSHFIRTWDGDVLGNGDAPTGVIETPSFTLGPDSRFEFLVGGGYHPFTGDPDNPNANMAAVTLEHEVAPGDWEVLFSSTGAGGLGDGNTLRPDVWDAGLYEGETVRLRIYDTHSGGWGHIDVDDIRYTTVIPEPSAPALLVGVGLATLLMRRRPRQ